MLAETLQFRIEFDDVLDRCTNIALIIIRLRCSLKAAECGPAVRVGAVNDNDFGVAEVIEHLQPDIGLMIVRRHGTQKRYMDIFVRECGVA